MYLQSSLFTLLLASSDAFSLTASKRSNILFHRVKSSASALNGMSRRDAFLTGAAALFGSAAMPKPCMAKEEAASSSPSEQENDDVSPIFINGAFVTMGYASLAGSLISDGILDSTPELQNLDPAVLEVVETNFASSVESVSPVAETFNMDALENMYESTDLSTDPMNFS